MQKLYKYRSFSPALYKELFYQEIYFASCHELNDPLDLNIPVEYNVKDKKQISALTWLLFKHTLVLKENISEEERLNNAKYMRFVRDEKKVKDFQELIFNHMVTLKGDLPYIYRDLAQQAIFLAIEEAGVDFTMDVYKLFHDIERLSKLFLTNSYVTCFSTDANSWLMWSHYASSHHGICLEFSLPQDGKFPFEMEGRREFSIGSIHDGFAKATLNKYIYSDEIFPIKYSAEPLNINFFDFAPVFNNELDADLRGLTKSYWHKYAHQLQNLFAIKTTTWSYEKECRVIEVNFEGPKEPEERLRHYPIELLTAIYFGYNMPDATKNRIANIYLKKSHKIKFNNCKLTNARELIYELWEFDTKD